MRRPNVGVDALSVQKALYAEENLCAERRLNCALRSVQGRSPLCGRSPSMCGYCSLNVKECHLSIVEGASLWAEALFGVDEALCAKEARGPLWVVVPLCVEESLC